MSDSQIFSASKPRFAAWLVEPMLENRRTYIKVAVAAAMINVFGLVTSIFTMTVYDRVLPNNATSSLVALTIGIVFVVVFDFLLRTLRSYFVDIAGANVDRDVGDSAFRKLMTMRLDKKRGSTGAIAGTLRELETLRDFFASASLSTLIDVPFIVLSLAVIALIGGWVVIVPLLMVPLVIIAGVATFPAMDRLSAESMNERLHKQSVLVEAIGGIETVKATGAGHLLTRRWLHAIDMQSELGTRQRLIASLSTNVANAAQTLSYVGVIVIGVLMVERQELTTGGLIACSLLSSRAVAPLAQIAQLLSRLTMTRTAYRTLNVFMEQEHENEGGTSIQLNRIDGKIEFRNVSFKYPGAKDFALENVNLKIEPGERLGILGRVGSGKSTIARLVLGLYEPAEGLVLLDGTDVRQIDAASMRKHIGSALQESVLLTGSIRENITLDHDDIDEDEMIRASQLAGAHGFVTRITNGYNVNLSDRGESLSGGQRQSIAVARALAGKPRLLIFDEPTSSMDAQSEQALIQRLAGEVQDRTMLIITHRTPMLALCTRIIVIDDGKIQMDGPRDAVLKKLTQPAAA